MGHAAGVAVDEIDVKKLVEAGVAVDEIDVKKLVEELDARSRYPR